MSNRSLRPSLRLLLAYALPLLAGAGLRLAWATVNPHVIIYDEVAYQGLALKLYRGEEYGLPFWPPGWPMLLSLLYRIFRPEVVVGVWFNTIISLLTLALFGSVVAKLFGQRAAVLGLWTIALMPSFILVNVLLMYDVWLQFLLLLGVWFALQGAWTWARTIGILCITVLATLMRPFWIALPVLLWLGTVCYGRASKGYPKLIVAQVGALLVIMPWIVHASSLAGSLVPVAMNGGMNLWIGNNPSADGYFMQPPVGYFDPKNDALARSAALDYIRQHPLRTITLIPYKLWHLFRSEPWFNWVFDKTTVPFVNGISARVALLMNIPYWATLGAATLSVVVLLVRRRYCALAPFTLFVFNILSYLPFFGSFRFRWQAQFLLILYAVALPTLLRRRKPSDHAGEENMSATSVFAGLRDSDSHR